MTLNMDMGRLLSMSIHDLLDTIEEVAEVVNERKRVRTGDQDRGYRR